MMIVIETGDGKREKGWLANQVCFQICNFKYCEIKSEFCFGISVLVEIWISCRYVWCLCI